MHIKMQHAICRHAISLNIISVKPASKTMPQAIVLPASQQNDATSHRFTSQPAKRCHQASFHQPASKTMPPAIVLPASQQNDETY